VFEHYFGMSVLGMDGALVIDILDGREQDVLGLWWKYGGMIWAGNIGLVLLWIAAALTLVTGGDYLLKALPYLKDEG
jgi:CDP-diacylglycerol--glycerol-3-phosphate 3-phosphatidyltransferase